MLIHSHLIIILSRLHYLQYTWVKSTSDKLFLCFSKFHN
ncbi:hypothetical protein VPH184E373B_0064 [Vibrio phage 184E37-3b]